MRQECPDNVAVKPARQGRENQRYGEEGQRLVAGCIVLRQVSLPCSPLAARGDSCVARGQRLEREPRGGFDSA